MKTRSWKIIPDPSPNRTSTPEVAKPVGNVMTTGLFRVPTGAGNPITLSVYVSSFADETERTQVQINRKVGAALRPVLCRTLAVGPNRVEKVDVRGLAGSIVEVNVATSSNRLKPSAAVTEFFPADAGVLVYVWKSPGDFVQS